MRFGRSARLKSMISTYDGIAAAIHNRPLSQHGPASFFHNHSPLLAATSSRQFPRRNGPDAGFSHTRIGQIGQSLSLTRRYRVKKE